MLFLRRLKFLLIPALMFGIFLFPGNGLADQWACDAFEPTDEAGCISELTCEVTAPYVAGTCTLNESPGGCESMPDDISCLDSQCSWQIDHCIDPLNGLPQIFCASQLNESDCEWVIAGEGDLCSWNAGNDLICTFIEEGTTGLPEFEEGDIAGILAGLTAAFQGILDFMISGGTLWFTIAGAFLIIYFVRRVLTLRKVVGKIDQIKSMKNFSRRQESLRKLQEKNRRK